MVVFDGLSVTPDVQTMIEKYYVGNILLTARNIRGTDSLACMIPYLGALMCSQTVYRPQPLHRSCRRLRKLPGSTTRS